MEQLKSVRDLRRGDIVRNKAGDGSAYVVDRVVHHREGDGARASAVRTIEVTNPFEWLVLRPENDDASETRLAAEPGRLSGRASADFGELQLLAQALADATGERVPFAAGPLSLAALPSAAVRFVGGDAPSEWPPCLSYEWWCPRIKVKLRIVECEPGLRPKLRMEAQDFPGGPWREFGDEQFFLEELAATNHLRANYEGSVASSAEALGQRDEARQEVGRLTALVNAQASATHRDATEHAHEIAWLRGLLSEERKRADDTLRGVSTALTNRRRQVERLEELAAVRLAEIRLLRAEREEIRARGWTDEILAEALEISPSPFLFRRTEAESMAEEPATLRGAAPLTAEWIDRSKAVTHEVAAVLAEDPDSGGAWISIEQVNNSDPVIVVKVAARELRAPFDWSDPPALIRLRAERLVKELREAVRGRVQPQEIRAAAEEAVSAVGRIAEVPDRIEIPVCPGVGQVLFGSAFLCGKCGARGRLIEGEGGKMVIPPHAPGSCAP